MSRGWSLPICLITLLSTSGWALGQSGNTFHQEPENSFLKPYSPETNNQSNQSLDASIKTNTIDTINKPNIGKTSNKAISTIPPKSSKPTFGYHQKSGNQTESPKISTPGLVLSFQGYNQGHPTGSGSFLDGYLLKSLNEKRIVRKKAAEDGSADGNSVKKKKKLDVK